MKEFKLDHIDPEDFGDSLLKLEKSFGSKFAGESFKGAKTFGDICDIIESQINTAEKDDCTTQQAFYKIRKTIGLTQDFDKRNIKPQTKLEDIFPHSDRRKKVKLFQEALGFSVQILTIETRLAIIIFVGFFLSLIEFFFSWQLACSALAFFTLFTLAVNKF